MRTLRQLRDDRGWGAKEAADHIGVSMATLYNWEAGKTEPRARQFQRIAKAYGVAMEEIQLPDYGDRRPDDSETAI